MKKIHLHNYKEFAIDYMVGQLSAEEMEAFSSFLAEYPTIANDILLFETEAPAERLATKSFSHLKKEIAHQDINEDNFEEYCIAAMEGDLTDEATENLTIFIGDHAQRHTVKVQYEQTKLVPEHTIYQHKDSLKKTERRPLLYRRLITTASTLTAASIILFALIFVLPESGQTPITLANNTSIAASDTTPQETPQVLKAVAPKLLENNSTQKSVAEAALTPTHKKEIKKQITKASPTVTKQKYSTPIVTLKKREAKKINLPHPTLELDNMALAQSPPELQAGKHIAVEEDKNILRTQTRKLFYSTVLAQGVKSINRMAETELDYDVIEDEEGNPIRVIVKSRFGEIDRTLAQR